MIIELGRKLLPGKSPHFQTVVNPQPYFVINGISLYRLRHRAPFLFTMSIRFMTDITRHI